MNLTLLVVMRKKEGEEKKEILKIIQACIGHAHPMFIYMIDQAKERE
jgi:hypothetical protein